MSYISSYNTIIDNFNFYTIHEYIYLIHLCSCSYNINFKLNDDEKTVTNKYN